MLSRFQLCPTSCDPWTVALQAPLSMGFFRQEYWSGLPCPPPGDILNPGIKLSSLTTPALAGGFFTTSATWENQGLSRVSNKALGEGGLSARLAISIIITTTITITRFDYF